MSIVCSAIFAMEPANEILVDLKRLQRDTASGKPATPVGVVIAKPRALRRLGTAAASVVIAAVAAAWFLRTASPPLPPPRSVPITTYPGIETDPAFSPDGNQVTFAWNGEKRDNYDIYVKLVAGGAPLRLTTNPADEYRPVWSPDGRQIAFIREGSGVYSISPLGGPERKLLDGSVAGLAWMSDSQSLLVSWAKSRAELHSVYQFSVRTGEMRQVTTPPPQTNPADGDWVPAISPDGQTLAFLRSVGESIDVYVQPLAGGPARRLTKSSQLINGLAWLNDREVVFSSGSSFLGGSLWRITVGGKAEPEAVAGAVDGARHPAVVHPAGRPARLAYSRGIGDTNIWRIEVALDADGRVRTVSEPAPVIASTRVEQQPQFSPDGKRIVFASDRDGFMEIWVSASDGSNPPIDHVQERALRHAALVSRWPPDRVRLAGFGQQRHLGSRVRGRHAEAGHEGTVQRRAS